MIVSGCITHNTPSDHDTAAAMPSQMARPRRQAERAEADGDQQIFETGLAHAHATGGFSTANGLGATIRKVRNAMSGLRRARSSTAPARLACRQ
jgi:hypothetical protein